MKTFRLALLSPALLFGAAVHGQETTELLHRSHLGVVYETADGTGVGVQLKFDFAGSPAEQTYVIEKQPFNIVPVAGRWDPDTTESVGFLERTSRGRFYLRTAQTTGGATLDFDFFATPQSGLLFPVMGDWDGDGLDSAGIYNRNTGYIHLKNSNTQAEPPDSHLLPGVAGNGSRPVAGDWDGDGSDGIAILLPNLNPKVVRFFEDPYGTGFTDYSLPAIPAGAGSLWPVAGDWNYDGKDFIGVYGAGDQTFYLLATEQSGDWDVILPFPVSEPGAKPVAGSWDGESFRYAASRTAGGQRPAAFPQLVAAGDDHELYFSARSEVLGSPTYDSLYFNLYSDSASEGLYSNQQWALDPSVEILGHPVAAIALGTVFTSPTAEFKHPDGSLHKKMAVYVVEHATPADFSGWVCLTYYSDASGQWTVPIFATTDPGTPPSPCVGDGFVDDIIPAEAVSGFREGSDLHIGVMEGDFEELFAGVGTDRTLTYLFKASTTKPWYLEVQDQLTEKGEFTAAGINTPNTAAGGNPPWVYNYGINLDFTLDPVEHAVYWARAYPYPFDIDGGIPCDNQGCPSGVSLNPNRAQIYRIQLAPGKTFGEQLDTFFAGPWELVADVGAPKGYPTNSTAGVCGATELIDESQDGLAGIDINSLTFVKDGEGRIARDFEGRRAVLFGGAAVKDKANGECDFGDKSMFVWPVDLLLNQPPVAGDDYFFTGWETPVNIPFSALLANDTDPDGEPGDPPLTVCGLGDPQHGTFQNFPGSVTYTPPAGCLVNRDSFEYTVCDGDDGEGTGLVDVEIGGLVCPSGGNKSTAVTLGGSPDSTVSVPRRYTE